MNISKACQNTDNPTKIIKSNADLLFRNFNYCLEKSEIPCMLKHADVVPVHKKKEKTDRANYRPMSILPNISEIYEKLMYQQLHDHFDSILSRKQCGFGKGHSGRNSLMVMLEKFKESRGRGDEFGALFTDLSKPFDRIDHNLLITKLSWHGVTTKSLNFIFSYLRSRTQSVRINNSYSNKREIMNGVPQVSVLGPLLFNIDLIDLFLECKDNINSYADDTTPYSCAEGMSSVLYFCIILFCTIQYYTFQCTSTLYFPCLRFFFIDRT